MLAAQNRSEDDLEKLRGLCDKMHTSLNDIEQYANSSTEFHISIARATHNSILAEIFEAMRYVMYDYQKNNMRTLGEVLRSMSIWSCSKHWSGGTPPNASSLCGCISIIPRTFTSGTVRSEKEVCPLRNLPIDPDESYYFFFWSFSSISFCAATV